MARGQRRRGEDLTPPGGEEAVEVRGGGRLEVRDRCGLFSLVLASGWYAGVGQWELSPFGLEDVP